MTEQHFCVFLKDLKIGLAEALVYRRLCTLWWASSVPKYADAMGEYMIVAPKLFYKYQPTDTEVDELNKTYKSLEDKGVLNFTSDTVNPNIKRVYYSLKEN